MRIQMLKLYYAKNCTSNSTKSSTLRLRRIVDILLKEETVGKKRFLIIKTTLLNEMIDDWKEFLGLTTSEQDIKMLQLHERTGRPLGNDGFLTRIENAIGRILKPKRPGRKPKKGKYMYGVPRLNGVFRY